MTQTEKEALRDYIVSYLIANSQTINGLPDVTSLDGISSFPVIQQLDGNKYIAKKVPFNMMITEFRYDSGYIQYKDLTTGNWINIISDVELAEKIDLSRYVNIDMDQIINGIKTFNDSPIVPDPITSQQVTNKGYVDSSLLLKVDKTSKIISGNGLIGGGDLSSDLTINIESANDGILINSDNIELQTVNNLYSESITKPLSSLLGKILNDTKVDKTITINNYLLNNDVFLSKSDIGLSNVDNTSDVNKPISESTQNALNLKADLVNGQIPASQLPSYVDDILEYPNLLAFPLEGENGKLYIDLQYNLTYRWSGSIYVEVGKSLALGETDSTAYRGDRGKVAYDHSLLKDNPHSVTKIQVGLSNVDNTSDMNKPISTDLQTALNSKVDKTTTITAGAGLTGGGDLLSNRTINIDSANDGIIINADNIQLNTIDNLTTISTTKPLSANQGKLLSDKVAQVETDLNYMYPAVPYTKRVTADGGQIASKEITEEMYQKMLDLLPNTKVLFCPQTGIKTRASGVNLYASKLYDMSANNNDAVQATEANQPFVVGNIAPNERRGVKYLLKQTQNGLLDHTDVSFLSTESWSVILALKANRKANTILTLGNCYVEFTQSGITLTRGSTVVLYGPHSIVLGATNILEFQYSNGFGVIKVNGEPVATAVTASAITFGQLYFNSSFPLDGVVYYYSVFNKRLQESESEALYKYLRTIYPDIEGVDIGNQHWATSNYEGVVTGNGVIIPEVQADSIIAATELSKTDFESSLSGAVNNDMGGALYTYYRNSDNPISGNYDGRLIVTSVGTSTSRPSISYNGQNSVIGKYYNISFKYKVNSGTCVFAGIFDGVSVLGRQLLSGSGVYNINILAKNTISLTNIYFDGTNLFDLQIDDFVVKEVGWADLTTAGWSYFNNDPLMGAIYGKLYNIYAVTEIAKNPPKGWRVPTIADFTQLANYLGGAPVAGGKLKKDGISYFNTPNSGADNSSGFSMLGAGRRGSISGGFADYRVSAILGTSDKFPSGAWGFVAKYDTIAINPSDYAVPPSDKNGFSLRLIRVSPVGDQVQRLRTGVFTTNIASGVSDKLLSIPFGYRVTDITVKSALALTNVICTMYNYTNTTLQGTLLTGKSVAAGAEVNFATNYDAAIQYQDPVLRFNATGNGSDGMEILVTIQKVLV